MPTKPKKPQVNIPAAVRKIVISGSEGSIDTGILLREVVEMWGGPHKLAQSFFEEFQHAAKGSMVRTRTLEMISRLIVNSTAQELTNIKKPAAMEDSELMSELARLTGKVTGGTEVPEEADAEEPRQ